MVDASCKLFLELYFQEMKEKSNYFRFFQKSYKIKKYQNNKIYNSKNCNRINFIHAKLKFHTKS